MDSHAPADYACPFCRILRSTVGATATDMICATEQVSAFLALSRWPHNPVDVLVVPNEHFENLYDLPLSYAEPLHALTRTVALALKAVYHCEGVSTRQHNEPAGNQDVWHYHIHVTPRFVRDGFYGASKVPFPEAERLEQARSLREYLQTRAASRLGT